MKALYIEVRNGKEVELYKNKETERAVKLGIYKFLKDLESEKELKNIKTKELKNLKTK